MKKRLHGEYPGKVVYSFIELEMMYEGTAWNNKATGSARIIEGTFLTHCEKSRQGLIHRSAEPESR
jgi:hypothetical protein